MFRRLPGRQADLRASIADPLRVSSRPGYKHATSPGIVSKVRADMLQSLACDVSGAWPFGGLASPWKFCLFRVAMALDSTQLLHQLQLATIAVPMPAVAVLTALRPYLQLPLLQGQEFALLYTGMKSSYAWIDGNFQPDLCAEGRATLHHWVLMPQNDRRILCSQAATLHHYDVDRPWKERPESEASS